MMSRDRARHDEAVRTSPRWSVDEYRELIEQVHDCIRDHVPSGSIVLIASKGDDELLRIEGYQAWHFPRGAGGVYAGHYPADSVEALVHLRHLHAKGARYLVFPWTAHWWLGYYRELAAHLDTAHEAKLTRDGVCVIYALRESAAFDAFEPKGAMEPPPDDDRAPEPPPLVSLVRTRARPSLRVLTVLARFGTEQYPHAEEEIDQIFARQMPDIDRKVVIVDNAVPADVIDERPGAVLLGGDNGAHEFSAFDRAVALVGPDIWSFDLVHFATSAFRQLYVAYLERFDTRLLEAIAGRAVCVGHVDCYNEPVEVLTYRSQHWVRSCFFMLPPAEVTAVGSLVSITDDGSFFSRDPQQPFLADAPISRRYREYLTTWLTGGDIGQGVGWHSSVELTAETLPRFAQKARAILNEQLLSIRLRALGCHVVDVTWLSTMLRHTGADGIQWATPWREQLAMRDRDAILVPHPPTRVAAIAV